MTMTISSSAFQNEGEIPTAHTCEGKDVSPPLRFSNVPGPAKSLALIVDDPDAPDPKAPKMTWVHWIVFNLPAGMTSLPEDAARHGVPAAAEQGINDWHKKTWGGPCPPIGRHRYFFKLYALDVTLDPNLSPTKAGLEKAMEGHVIATAQMFGTYQKKA